MNSTSHRSAKAAALLLTLACLGKCELVMAQVPSTSSTTPSSKANAMTVHATGSFEVKLLPQPAADAESGLGRMSIDKVFSGDLQGTSKGEMLAGGTAVKGSAGYVAIERVTGTLHGHPGSFMLQHLGTMNRGAPSLTVLVIPDSGTGELTGLSGTLNIDITGGKHLYSMDYELPAKP
jgi:hypothetical protein